MGYRNETEHLRHRVEQLEGELSDIKSARRGGDEANHEARGKRQRIFLIGLAVLASATAGFCIVPTTMAWFEEMDVSSLSDVVSARSREIHTFRGTIDASQVFDRGYSVGSGPLIEDPRVIIRCTFRCPPGLDYYATQNIPGERTMRGEVSELDDYAFAAVGVDRLEEYATVHGLTLSELRVVTLTSSEDSPLPAFFVMLGVLMLSALGLWIAVLWHRHALRSEAPMPVAGDYGLPDAGTTLLLTIVTCRLYELVWIYRSTAKLRRLTGRRDLIPGLDVMLTLVTFGLWGYWVYYRNVEAVDDVLTASGMHTPQVGGVVGLTFGSFVCGILHWVLIYRVQEIYNRLVIEKISVEDL